MTTIYKITLRGVTGAAYAMFENGVCAQFINELETNTNSSVLFSLLPLHEVQFKGLTGITIGELKAKSASDKIALFCFMYTKHKGTTYRSTKEDRANIVHVSVTEPLLNTYFKATQYPLAGLKSISDYVRHYNEVRDLATNGTPAKKSSFPNVYDKQYEQMIGEDISKLQRYWAHLREQGWKKIDGVWQAATVATLLLLLVGCSHKVVKHNPRYRQDDDKALNAWLDAEHPRKVKATVVVKKRKRR